MVLTSAFKVNMNTWFHTFETENAGESVDSQGPNKTKKLTHAIITKVKTFVVTEKHMTFTPLTLYRQRLLGITWLWHYLVPAPEWTWFTLHTSLACYSLWTLTIFFYVSLFVPAPDQSTKRTEGKKSVFSYWSEMWFNSCSSGLITYRSHYPSLFPHISSFYFIFFKCNPRLLCPTSLSISTSLFSLPQFSPGISSAPVSASLWYQAKRLQGLPWSEHREGEVAPVFKDQKGETVKCPAFTKKDKLTKAVLVYVETTSLNKFC